MFFYIFDRILHIENTRLEIVIEFFEIPGSLMEKISARESKRTSAKKSSDRSVYSQKAVRAKEALTEKKRLESASKTHKF